MNIETGRIYEGEEDIAAARHRGEPLVELHGRHATAGRRLRSEGRSGFDSGALSDLARAERQRRRKAARRSRVANGQRRRGKR